MRRLPVIVTAHGAGRRPGLAAGAGGLGSRRPGWHVIGFAVPNGHAAERPRDFSLEPLHPILRWLLLLGHNGSYRSLAAELGISARRLRYLIDEVPAEDRRRTRVSFPEGDRILAAAGLHYRHLRRPWLD